MEINKSDFIAFFYKYGVYRIREYNKNYKANNSLNILFRESESSDDRLPNLFKTKDLSMVDIADFIMEGFKRPAEL